MRNFIANNRSHHTTVQWVMTTMNPRSSAQCLFDPDQHPEATLKVFNEFCESFTLRYNTLYPDPPKCRWMQPSLDGRLRRLLTMYLIRNQMSTSTTLSVMRGVHEKKWQSFSVCSLLNAFGFRLSQTALLGRCFCSTCVGSTNLRRTQHSRTSISGSSLNMPTKLSQHFRIASRSKPLIQVHTQRLHSRANSKRGTRLERIGTHFQQIREEALLKSWDLATRRTLGMKINGKCFEGWL